LKGKSKPGASADVDVEARGGARVGAAVTVGERVGDLRWEEVDEDLRCGVALVLLDEKNSKSRSESESVIYLFGFSEGKRSSSSGCREEADADWSLIQYRGSSSCISNSSSRPRFVSVRSLADLENSSKKVRLGVRG
jgi:hypothetical protein